MLACSFRPPAFVGPCALWPVTGSLCRLRTGSTLLLDYSSILLGLWLLPGEEGEPELAVGVLCLGV